MAVMRLSSFFLGCMIKSVDIKVFPDLLTDTLFHRQLIERKIKHPAASIRDIVLTRRSIDARGRRPLFILRYDIYFEENFIPPVPIRSRYQHVKDKPVIHIIGAGPAGYFAALECLEYGFCPVVLDRGKDVRQRRRDLRAIQQMGTVHPDSNYCFGEGGAGTYSDGKLYTRSHKRGNIEKTLRILVEHGASPDILVDAHPHIGSNKLPGIISAIRHTIEEFGGQVLFDHKVTDLIVENSVLKAIRCGDTTFETERVILATGHSARDIYQLLFEKGVYMEAKPFALGLRIEHPQSYIDHVQYHQNPREAQLPASSYSVVTQVDGCGVFSFCMCPGGLIVPASTAPGEIVVNGMSLSRRDSPFANSGLVTSIDPEELASHGYEGIFACLDFQKDVERKMFAAGDGSQKAPAQRVRDFVDGVVSSGLSGSSYIPGLFSAPLHSLLPEFVYKRLRQGIIQINKKMRGYMTNEALIVGVESRTSAPLKIPRDKETTQHVQIKGLYPCGEGAGYAGGILSAAMDGQNVVRAIAQNFQSVFTK